jgi:hypothetical protein
MKNKRWTREAKRIKGVCINNKSCSTLNSICSCYDRCHKIKDKVLISPYNLGIREMEQYCKKTTKY